MKKPSRKEIERLFAYDPAMGAFIWKINTSPHQRIGKMAGAVTVLPTGGYRRLPINGTTYLASHVAWFLGTGKWPVEEMDHINGVRHDDRFCNLREATRAENTRNTRRHSSCEYKGVAKEHGKGWRAQIRLGKKNVYLGCFDTQVRAAKAYDLAATKHFGAFARLNFSAYRDWLIV